jgi:hypothetical protein
VEKLQLFGRQSIKLSNSLPHVLDRCEVELLEERNVEHTRERGFEEMKAEGVSEPYEELRVVAKERSEIGPCERRPHP